MRISINLASRPFVELRPLFAQLRLAMAALLLLAAGLSYGVHVLSVRAAAAGAEMNQLKAQTARVQGATAANQARMRRPENQGVLERSQFLNALFAQKSFSWTAVMMDLEHVLPVGVQVTAIEPVISKEGAVSIRLRVTGDRDKAIQLVRNLEHSQRFLDPRISGESSLASDKARAIGSSGSASLQNVNANPLDLGSAVEFEIYSGYNPLPETAAKTDKTGARIAPRTAPRTAARTASKALSKPRPASQPQGRAR
jgi:type IV pilus assembly protein PilN